MHHLSIDITHNKKGGNELANNEAVVCRCEEVTYKELEETMKEFNCDARELKLRTRAGMGYCGGRTCRSMIESFTESKQTQSDEQIPLKYQAPIRPIPFGKLGES